METILGIDIGTKTGLAILHGKDCLWSATRVTWKSGEPDHVRWVRFWEYINEWVLEAHSLTGQYPIVAYELVRSHRGTRAGHVYGGFRSVLEIACSDDRLMPIPVNVWKKVAVGHGNANKAAYIAWANRRFRKNLTAKNEDEAAALGIAEAARIILEGEGDER